MPRRPVLTGLLNAAGGREPPGHGAGKRFDKIPERVLPPW
jgi:hypothetical protein